MALHAQYGWAVALRTIRHGASLTNQIPTGEREKQRGGHRGDPPNGPPHWICQPDGRDVLGGLNKSPQRDEIDQKRPASWIAQGAHQVFGIKGLVVEKCRNDFMCSTH